MASQHCGLWGHQIQLKKNKKWETKKKEESSEGGRGEDNAIPSPLLNINKNKIKKMVEIAPSSSQHQKIKIKPQNAKKNNKNKNNKAGQDVITQTNVVVNPRATIYTFAGAGISLTVTFSSPVFPDDLETFALPISYIEFAVTATDGTDHSIDLYFDMTGETVTSAGSHFVNWDRGTTDGVTWLRMGKDDQAPFESSDDLV